jgi:chromosomal replication initiation ATPase DnaA
MNQVIFDWPTHESFAADDFVVTPANQMAVQALMAWPDWPYFAGILTGPASSGKTHLANLFAARFGAVILKPDDLNDAGLENIMAQSGPVIIDPLDAADLGAERSAMLLHLHNILQSARRALVICARTPPSRWPIALPDLASRLRALPLWQLQQPDEATLTIVLQKLFADRQLHVEAHILHYLVQRMERSFAAARQWVERLDRQGLIRQQPITLPLIRELIQATDKGQD